MRLNVYVFPSSALYARRTAWALMVIPRSRSRSILSRNCACISRAVMAPVASRMRSASVDLPWSMCAMIEKFRRSSLATLRPFSVPFREPRKRFRQADVDVDARLPPRRFAVSARVDDGSLLLARARVGVRDDDVPALREDGGEPHDVRLLRRAHVEPAMRPLLDGGGVGGDDVVDVDVVARLLAVAEDRDGLLVEDAAAEDGDDAGFPVRVLSRAVHVAVAQRRRRDAVHAVVPVEVLL